MSEKKLQPGDIAEDGRIFVRDVPVALAGGISVFFEEGANATGGQSFGPSQGDKKDVGVYAEQGSPSHEHLKCLLD